MCCCVMSLQPSLFIASQDCHDRKHVGLVSRPTHETLMLANWANLVKVKGHERKDNEVHMSLYSREKFCWISMWPFMSMFAFEQPLHTSEGAQRERPFLPEFFQIYCKKTLLFGWQDNATIALWLIFHPFALHPLFSKPPRCAREFMDPPDPRTGNDLMPEGPQWARKS